MARASAAIAIGYSHRMVGRPMPSRCSILSNMMRKKTSSQVSPACIATPDGCESFSALADRREQVDAGMALERLGHGQPLGRRRGIADLVLPAQLLRAGERQQRRAILHDRLVARAGAIPFEHGELGMMQRRALGVAEDARELEELRARRRPAASSSRTRASCAASAARSSPSGVSQSVAKPARCTSAPGATCRIGVSTSTKPSAANHCRIAACSRARA